METIRVDKLSFTYPGCTEPALRDVSLSVNAGEFLVLCGASGCGKSTLLRQLKPVLTPHGKSTGTVFFRGEALSKLDERTAAAEIGFVMQSPAHQLVSDRVRHELAFGLESLGKDSDYIRRKTAEIAAFFGIGDWFDKNVSELSGGQQQLLCLASVMVTDPAVLILDEPTAQLDPIAASDFFSALGRINRELGTTVIMSEHRLEEAFVYADKAAVMENGSISFCGTVRETGRSLRDAGSEMFRAMPAAMRIRGALGSSADYPVTVNDGKDFVRDYLTEHTLLPLRDSGEKNGFGEELVTADGVWFRYAPQLPDTLRGLELHAHAGELYCILGGNGSGKTTALSLLAGTGKPTRGDVAVRGRAVLLPQDPETVFVKNTVYEDMLDALRDQKIKTAEKEEAIARAAKLCRISGLLSRHPYDLSGGEQQRAALAKLLLLSPDILLLDEPAKGLDTPMRDILAGILIQLKNSGVCVIVVSHDVEFCAKYADTCGLFFDGGIVTEGRPADFFSGNSFYTTAANRIIRDYEPRAVTTEEVIGLLGGELPESPAVPEEAAVPVLKQAPAPPKKKLPLWRKLAAAVAASGALGVLIYSSRTETLSGLVGTGGLTDSGMKQLAVYGILIGLLVLTAVFLGRRAAPSIELQTPADKRKISKRTAIASGLILLAIPLTLFVGARYMEKKQYYVTALLVLLECMLPFFLIFEGRKPKAREIVTVASLCALAVAGRAVFFMLPQFKPVMAFTIIAGVAFGGETGFLTGALSMLVSNMLFSQGPWTPWQMFAMGITGFLAGVLYRKGFLVRSAGSLAVFGALAALIIYGGIMNPSTVFIWGSETISAKIILGYYVTGFPMDAIHAASTAIFLWFAAEPMLGKLDRIKTKYGLNE